MIEQRPDSPRSEFVAFAHGMGNFSHNRGTTQAQASLLRGALGDRHELLGVFDDSGNFAVASAAGPLAVRTDLLAGLNRD